MKLQFACKDRENISFYSIFILYFFIFQLKSSTFAGKIVKHLFTQALQWKQKEA